NEERPGEAGVDAPGAVRPVENDDIASFPFERRHATPQGSVERHPGKAYIRMGIVLETVKGRDLKRAALDASTRDVVQRQCSGTSAATGRLPAHRADNVELASFRSS